MKRTTAPVMISILLLWLAGVAALSADYGPGPIVIDDVTKATNRYLGVRFSHEKHVDAVGLSCVMCHHTEKKDFVSGTPVPCESCHNASSEISFKDAMHTRCVMCHIKKVREADLGLGEPEKETAANPPPTQCLQCHRQRQ
jgi:hypothetical protein